MCFCCAVHAAGEPPLRRTISVVSIEWFEEPLRGVLCVAQSMLLVNVVYFAFLCHLTLPLYSLVVHMGSDIKREALPAELRERLQRTRDHYNQASHANK